MVDAIVIGSGPNGLVAANLLADAGWSVQVLEAEPEPGGAVRSGELTLPGFVHDRFSSFYPLAVASPVIQRLELERHGLRWCRHPLPVAHPARDGTVAYVAPDVEETARGLDAFAPGDGDAWRRYAELWDRVGDHLLGALAHAVPARPARRAAPGRSGLPRHGRLRALRPAAGAPLRRRGVPRARAPRAWSPATPSTATSLPSSPAARSSAGSCASLAQDVGFPIPEGGSSALPQAMVRRLEGLGVTIVCETRVTGIEVRRGRAVGVRTEHGDVVQARRAVLADVGAPPALHRRCWPRSTSRRRSGARWSASSTATRRSRSTTRSTARSRG